MKTPREILLAQHRAAEPKLDAIRYEVITEINRKGDKAQSQINLVSLCLGGFNKLWFELIFPSRRIWAGLAAAWILILIANISLRNQQQATMAKASPTPEMILAFRQQEKLLSELIGQREAQPAEPPKIFTPRPSSRRQFEILSA
jgi:hypothetical protein